MKNVNGKRWCKSKCRKLDNAKGSRTTFHHPCVFCKCSACRNLFNTTDRTSLGRSVLSTGCAPAQSCCRVWGQCLHSTCCGFWAENTREDLSQKPSPTSSLCLTSCRRSNPQHLLLPCFNSLLVVSALCRS